MAIRSAVSVMLVGMLALAGGNSTAVAQGSAVQTNALEGNALQPVLPAGQTAAPAVQSPTLEVQTATPAVQTAGPAIQTATPAVQIPAMAPGDSHVRIVRLSEIRGSVKMDRKTGHGLEAAIANMPIVEGARLETEIGVAEVEFEDGSAVRLTPNSLIEFPQLILRGAGGMASTVRLVHGLMYVSLANTKANSFTVQVGDGSTSVVVAPSTHVRLEAEAAKVPNVSESGGGGSDKIQSVAKLTIAVFAGSVAVQSPSGPSVVGKKETLTVGGAEHQPGDLVAEKNVGKNAFDTWDKDEQSYQQRYTRGNTFGGSPFNYGNSDLNYYGSFVNMGGGCGSMWQPYFVGAGWDPYANGTWAMYPGAGYSWVSAYPWGWAPYHSGQWVNCGGAGWGWQPGGGFVGLNNVAGTVTSPASGSGTPVHSLVPVRPLVTGGASLVVANRVPLAVSTVNAQGNFEFRNNSAGVGVPRGDLGDLRGMSREVARHGMVSLPVEVGPGGTSQGVRGPASLRPATSTGGMERGNWAGGAGAQASHTGGGNYSGGHSAGGGAPPTSGGGASGGAAPASAGAGTHK
jgi:FecR protein